MSYSVWFSTASLCRYAERCFKGSEAQKSWIDCFECLDHSVEHITAWLCPELIVAVALQRFYSQQRVNIFTDHQ